VTKLKRRPFPCQDSYCATEQLELVHGDLCGLVSLATPGGRRYFLLLIDDATRYMWVVLLDSKVVAADAIKRHQVATEKECGRKLRVLCMDNSVSSQRPSSWRTTLMRGFSATTPRPTHHSIMAWSSTATRWWW
jgi:hypothetical protein